MGVCYIVCWLAASWQAGFFIPIDIHASVECTFEVHLEYIGNNDEEAALASASHTYGDL